MKNKTLIFWLIFIFGSLFLFIFTLTFITVLFNKEDLSLTKDGNIGIVEIEGIIIDIKEIAQNLKKFEENDDIKGIIVRIDSPGGAVGPSQELYEQIVKIRQTKKVIASLGSMAASGGYYVAAAADRIVANPGTLTGSIGVLMEHVNLEELYHWAKMKPETLKSGKFKDIGNPTRDMTVEERDILQEMLGDVHRQFKEDIIKSRTNLTMEMLDEIGDGRVFSGAMAKKLGLIDDLGNLYTSADILAKLIDLKEKPEMVYPKKKEPKIIDMLVDSTTKSIIDRISSQLPRQLLFSIPK